MLTSSLTGISVKCTVSAHIQFLHRTELVIKIVNGQYAVCLHSLSGAIKKHIITVANTMRDSLPGLCPCGVWELWLIWCPDEALVLSNRSNKSC